MFPFVKKTCNPLGGECKIGCSYCWAKMLSKKYGMRKYQGKHRIYEAQLEKIQHFGFNDSVVFVCDMLDLFEPTVPSIMIGRILAQIRKSKATFLLLTKNPRRYLEFNIPRNCICGATIETDLGNRQDRFYSMRELKHPRKMVSVEPILKFSPNFLSRLLDLKLECVAVGYDNYKNRLDEPLMFFTRALISGLEAHRIQVYEKTIRESWKIMENIKK